MSSPYDNRCADLTEMRKLGINRCVVQGKCGGAVINQIYIFDLAKVKTMRRFAMYRGKRKVVKAFQQ